MILRIFGCDLCVIAALDLLAHPHSSMPYVQMGLITAFRLAICFAMLGLSFSLLASQFLLLLKGGKIFSL
jgi:hypothetical protein